MKRILLLFVLSVLSHCLYSQVKIEMTEEGGVYKVPCEINGLKLQFIFDTGASTVSLSGSVADFMLKNGYLKAEDLYDQLDMKQANGSIFKAQKVRIRNFNIGGFVIHNIIGVIVPHQDAPLLMGQSAIQELGKISIKENYLIIEKTETIKYSGLEKDISFLGLKQWTSFSECYEKLCDRYGEYCVQKNEINGKVTLVVEKEFFNNILYDEIELYFDKGYLNSVELNIHYDIKNKNQAIKKRDEIYKTYAKKYTSIKKIQPSKNGFISYYIGYDNRTNINEYKNYLIILYINKLSSKEKTEETWIEKEYYRVTVTYWMASHMRWFENYSPEKDEY